MSHGNYKNNIHTMQIWKVFFWEKNNSWFGGCVNKVSSIIPHSAEKPRTGDRSTMRVLVCAESAELAVTVQPTSLQPAG